ncbi:hypothetical protein [Thioalkalivibrio sp. ALE31]|uniref:hypothetical protein n=1 Tax=Thioalkalivibrio sp. ALE31 TaxID=1158182 RepID=UPI001E3223B4|nr:hypothetical protein [Thioalkalivibrio sp. ALE31]
MTTEDETTAEDGHGADLSLLPEPDLGVRVRPAQFARMLNVSRQTVSRWVKEGRVLLDPSGRLDPVKATERVLQHGDPARLRATLLKPVMDDMAGLRSELREALERAEAAEDRAERAAARADEAEANVAMLEAAGDRFMDAVVTRLEHLVELEAPGAIRAELDELYMDALAAALEAQEAAAEAAGAAAGAPDDGTDLEDGTSLDISDLDLTPEPFESDAAALVIGDVPVEPEKGEGDSAAQSPPAGQGCASES